MRIIPIANKSVSCPHLETDEVKLMKLIYCIGCKYNMGLDEKEKSVSCDYPYRKSTPATFLKIVKEYPIRFVVKDGEESK